MFLFLISEKNILLKIEISCIIPRKFLAISMPNEDETEIFWIFEKIFGKIFDSPY